VLQTVLVVVFIIGTSTTTTTTTKKKKKKNKATTTTTTTNIKGVMLPKLTTNLKHISYLVVWHILAASEKK